MKKSWQLAVGSGQCKIEKIALMFYDGFFALDRLLSTAYYFLIGADAFYGAVGEFYYLVTVLQGC